LGKVNVSRRASTQRAASAEREEGEAREELDDSVDNANESPALPGTSQRTSSPEGRSSKKRKRTETNDLLQQLVDENRAKDDAWEKQVNL
jgi:hypothetical protein